MSDGNKSKVLCVGRLYCDLVFSDVPRLPSPGTEVYAGGLEMHLGGGALITAAHLADLAISTCLSTYLPVRPFRDFALDELQYSGMDTSLCANAEEGLDPQITVAITSSEDRSFLTRRTGPPFPALKFDDATALGVHHIHIGELASLVECPGTLDFARALGASISLDCSWDESLDASVAALITQVDLFLPNDGEVQRLRSLGVEEPFAPLTVIKKGRAGATAIRDGEVFSELAPEVQVVDSTGAGDAFNAGFLSAWLGGAPVSACLRAGNARGAQSVQTVGGSVRRPDTTATSPNH